MKENHDEIMKGIGGLEKGVENIVKRLDVLNGRIPKIEEKHTELEKRFLKIEDDNEDTKEYIKREEKKVEDKRNWKGNLALQVMVYVICGVIGAVCLQTWPYITLFFKR